MAIRVARPAELEDLSLRLGELLCDAVAANAGVSYLHPLDPQTARGFWRGHADGMEAGRTLLLLAETQGGVAGCVLLIKAPQPNQAHRGDIAKLLVHGDHRRQGFGSQLMRAAEARAREEGLTLLTFDAVAHGPVEDFYRRLGYTCIGYIPNFAKASRGEAYEDTAIFYKTLT